ncbi:MAG: (Dimethylallyl)adenosine tRNA methylthiotransferase MiaB [Methanosaeta sp. PtaU1.Bin028]|nr:MAG: (Dimethylallyl)adenosine tRNA methylthiotransferase MiaB [Methanosaeta sp. PtaU1.Bin028]
MRFYIESYGCTANHGNAADLKQRLEKLGWQEGSLEEADLVVVNTCAVTARAERKMLRRLQELDGPGLVAAGCLAAALPERLTDLSPGQVAGLLAGPALEDLLQNLPCSSLADTGAKANGIPVPPGPPPKDCRCGIVNISEGCNGCCTYCLVRRARGTLKSQPIDDLVDRVMAMGAAGYAEVQLASQDASSYGTDIGTDLPRLLNALSSVKDAFFFPNIRVGMMNPRTLFPVLDATISAFSSDRIYKFLHLPLQSGSDRILEAMNRGYTASQYLDMAGRFREEFPELYLATDVIAGFPGETEEDLSATLDVLKAAGPDKVNITRYSSRPGTLAAAWYDMPDRIKKDRSRQLTALWLETAKKRMASYLNTELEVLVTEKGAQGTSKARTGSYVQVVIPGTPLGSRCKVRIVASNPHYLTGQVLRLTGKPSTPGQGTRI